MDVGLLTLDPQTYNYGGFLQAMALQDAIIALGHNCEIINYLPLNELSTFSYRRNLRYLTREKVIQKVKSLFRAQEKRDYVLQSVSTRHGAFDNCRMESLRLSVPLTEKQLRGSRLPYDAVICGSDQIWNPDYNIPAFFLDFVYPEQKAVIYAASIGKDYLSDLQKSVYREMLKPLRHISVREKSAQEIIGRICGKSVELVLDPTLLQSKEYWNKKADLSNKQYEQYLFCYFLGPTRQKWDAVKRYAKDRSLKIVAIPYIHDREDIYSREWADIIDSNVGPLDFVKLIRDASCVITDSFHGTVFSALFHKEFWTFGRSYGPNNMNTRLDTLLEYFDAQSRMIQPEQLQYQTTGADYLDEQLALQIIRHVSWNYLSQSITNPNQEN